MKRAITLWGLLLTVVVAFALAGCAGRTGQGTFGNGGAVDGTLPGEGEESLSGTSVPAPPRPEGVNPETDVDYSVLSADTVYFGFDSTVIASAERGKIERVAQWMKENPDRMLFLAGHTDDRGTLEYNRGLGERRAQAVRDYLIGLGADGSKLSTISYGEERPAQQGETEQAWSANRRVEFGVVKK